MSLPDQSRPRPTPLTPSSFLLRPALCAPSHDPSLPPELEPEVRSGGRGPLGRGVGVDVDSARVRRGGGMDGGGRGGRGWEGVPEGGKREGVSQ